MHLEVEVNQMEIKGLKFRKAFTLIELVVVIAILGILSAISIPKLTGVVDNARIKADYATLKTLNTATDLLVLSKNTGAESIFSGAETDEDKIALLNNTGYLEKSKVKPQNKDATFEWDLASQEWCYTTSDGKMTVILDKDNIVETSNQLFNTIKMYTGNWEGQLPNRNINGAIVFRQDSEPVFMKGYFESVDGLDKTKINEFQVFFDFDKTNRKYTNKVLGIYIKLQVEKWGEEPSKAIYFSSGESVDLKNNSLNDYLVGQNEFGGWGGSQEYKKLVYH